MPRLSAVGIPGFQAEVDVKQHVTDTTGTLTDTQKSDKGQIYEGLVEGVNALSATLAKGDVAVVAKSAPAPAQQPQDNLTITVMFWGSVILLVVVIWSRSRKKDEALNKNSFDDHLRWQRESRKPVSAAMLAETNAQRFRREQRERNASSDSDDLAVAAALLAASSLRNEPSERTFYNPDSLTGDGGTFGGAGASAGWSDVSSSGGSDGGGGGD